VEARGISQDIDGCLPIGRDAPPREAVAATGLVRLCCAVTRLVRELNEGIPLTGKDLSPPLDSCHCCPSWKKESCWDSGWWGAR
jgi:hypothetical protein